MRQERRQPRSKLLKKMSTPAPEAAMADSQEDRTGGCDFTLSDVHRLLMDVEMTSIHVERTAAPVLLESNRVGEGASADPRQSVVQVQAPQGPVQSSVLLSGPWLPGGSNDQPKAAQSSSAPAPTRVLAPDQVLASKALVSLAASTSNKTTTVQGGLRVLRDLLVQGEAWKSGGSTQWRVLSDERAKDVLGDFRLGGGTLANISPRVFRYKGQPEHERPYAGIIAQELPPELVPFCRYCTALPPALRGPPPAIPAARPDDAPAKAPSTVHTQVAPVERPQMDVEAAVESAPTGSPAPATSSAAAAAPSGGAAPVAEPWLYLVDLSALQFVILNAATELQRQVRSRVISRDHPPRPDLGCGSGPNLP